MNENPLKTQDVFDWEKCKSFEEHTLSQFYKPIRVYLHDSNATIETLGKKEQLMGKDLRVESEGLTLFFEVKCDTHINSTNFFFEDISNSHTKTIGWTLKSQADFLCYGFFNTETQQLRKVFFLSMPDLKNWFKENYQKYTPKHIKNRGYYTIGRAIPIDTILGNWLIGYTSYIWYPSREN